MSSAPPPPGWYPDPRGINGQVYWDGQQWQFPPTPPPKRRRLQTIVVGVVIAAIAVLGILTHLGHHAHRSTSAQSSAQSGQSSAAPAPPAQVKLNQEARDGQLSFVVTSIDTSNVAQGTAVNVHLAVKNVSNRAATFWANNQRVWVGGRSIMPDVQATAKAGPASVKIDPGGSATVVVSFDVPADNTTVETIELHDAALSVGVNVLPRP
jgi:archaellum component FlaG (FlaF/FlaG flagellin family)